MIWNVSLEKRLVELSTSEEKYSSYKIASILSDEFNIKISRDSVKNKLTRVNFEQLVSKPKTNIMPYFDKYRDYYLGDKEELPKLNTSITKYPFKMMDKRDLNILHLCDLHVPFQVDEQVQLAVNRHNTSDILIISELSDCYSISRFNKTMSIPLEIEIDNIVRLYEYFSQNFPLTIILETNHDIRVEKTFLRSVPESVLFLAETHMLRKLAKPFPSVVIIPNWYFQINDCLFTHAETTSKTDTKSGINVYNFFTEWKDTLDLDDIRMYIQDHSHMLSSTFRGGGRVKVIESGCLCIPLEYPIDKLYSRPQVNGFTTIVQHGGVSDLALSREHYLAPLKYKINDKFLGLR